MNKKICVDIEYGRERDYFVEKLEFETKFHLSGSCRTRTCNPAVMSRLL